MPDVLAYEFANGIPELNGPQRVPLCGAADLIYIVEDVCDSGVHCIVGAAGNRSTMGMRFNASNACDPIYLTQFVVGEIPPCVQRAVAMGDLVCLRKVHVAASAALAYSPHFASVAGVQRHNLVSVYRLTEMDGRRLRDYFDQELS
jgi:hypothetical protein